MRGGEQPKINSKKNQGIRTFLSHFLFSEPKRGDVIVFKTPSDNRTDFIKRLIGFPGDEIQFINGELFINKEKITIT